MRWFLAPTSYLIAGEARGRGNTSPSPVDREVRECQRRSGLEFGKDHTQVEQSRPDRTFIVGRRRDCQTPSQILSSKFVQLFKQAVRR